MYIASLIIDFVILYKAKIMSLHYDKMKIHPELKKFY